MATWWKDRNTWVPGQPGDNSGHHSHDSEEEQLPAEDIGDVADDGDYVELEDVDLPDRGADQ